MSYAEGKNIDKAWGEMQVIRHPMETLPHAPIEVEPLIPGVNLVVAKDLDTLGTYIAQRLAGLINGANRQGLRVAFDMPTGSSPRSTYEALGKMAHEGKVDLSGVIWFGHEDDWPAQPEISYERQRLLILNQLGIQVSPISDRDVINGTLNGNYLTMHRYELNYPDSTPSLTVAQAQAQRYDHAVSCLLLRNDVLRLGIHGVGPDSHGWGEVQLKHLWPDVWKQTLKTFVEQSNDYTVRGGLWRLATVDGFYPGHNFVGNSHPNIFLMGLGRRQMLRTDYAIEIFNDNKKAQALAQTIAALKQERPGEGKALLSEFKNHATSLGIDCRKATNCHQVFQAVCSTFDHTTTETNYGPLWRLVDRYFGSQTPVAKMIAERSRAGKPTTLITTQSVRQAINN